jgi:carbonic anhydrase
VHYFERKGRGSSRRHAYVPLNNLQRSASSHIVLFSLFASLRLLSQYGNDKYNFAQLHIHSGSEHSLAGGHSDAELHLVHRKEG